MTMRGVGEWMAAIDGVVSGVDAAVRRSISEGALVQKQAIRANMGGAPRWVDGRNYPRGGGVGELTGKLRSGIGYTPVQRLGFGHYSTVLKAKRIYANKTESRYPYFVPGARRSEPEVHAIFYRNMARALS